MFYSRFYFNVHSYLDIFLHGSVSSFDNHWQYQQRYYELLGQKSASFIWCMKVCMNLNSTEWLVEMTEKNFEKDRKSFGTEDFPQACNFIKKRLHHTCFPVKFAKFLRTPFFRTPPVAASFGTVPKISKAIKKQAGFAWNFLETPMQLGNLVPQFGTNY